MISLLQLQPLLADNPVRPKALLSISALIHAYCRNHPDCHSEESVREAVRHIEDRIGIACRSRDEPEQNTILLALKALGNAGVIVSSTETLKKCYEVWYILLQLKRFNFNLTSFSLIFYSLF